MKRITCLILVLGLMVMFGCAQEKPEAAAKKIFEQQVASHQGLELDTSGLAYHLIKQGDHTAMVEVSGDMAVNATIPLVMKNGKWTLDMPTGEPPEKESAAHK